LSHTVASFQVFTAVLLKIQVVWDVIFVAMKC